MLGILIFVSIMGVLWSVNHKYTPKTPSFYGYKTPRSMKNQDTWIYANKKANSLFGFSILLVLALGVCLIYIFKIPSKQALSIVCWSFAFLSVLVIPVTEYLLYHKFYKGKK